MGVQINGSEGNVIATKGTYSGNVTIGGTLTYEDVTNIDSVGLVTARTGIEIGARPGVAASISVDGNMIVSGIATIGSKLGIGGITPSNALDVQGGATNTAIVARSTDSKAQISLVDNSTTSVGSVVVGAEGDALFLTSGSGGDERLRITANGNVLIGNGSVTSQEGDGRLIVYANTRLHPAIKADCIDGGSNTANGFTLIADNYGADESIVNLGVSYSGAGLVLSRGVKVSNAADDTYLSSMDSFALKPSVFKLDDSGDFIFLNTDTSATTTTDSAVSLSERLRITSDGNVGINQTPTRELSVHSPNNNNALIHFTNDDTGETASDGILVGLNGNEDMILNNQESSKNIIIYNGGSERLRIDSSGRFGLGTDNPDTLLHLKASSGSTLQRFESSSYSSYIAQIQSNDNVSNGSLAGQLHLRGQSGFSVSANNGTATHLTINTSGAISNTTTHTQGQTFVTLRGDGAGSNFSVMVFGANSGGHNTGSCAVALGKHSTNNRSLNAAGTVNASGNDYAEYMTKSGDFTLAKGDICGIDANGKLTNKFSESISFVVKSTDPSYVGGDAWGTEEILGEKPDDDSSDLPAYEEKYEAARKMVDRIAFSGQVPVNVTGATAGQHIIPTAGSGDTIIGVAKAEASLSMAEYMSSVGKVITLESDGRARIIVKVS